MHLTWLVQLNFDSHLFDKADTSGYFFHFSVFQAVVNFNKHLLHNLKYSLHSIR